MFLLWTAPIGLLLLIIVSFFDGCYKSRLRRLAVGLLRSPLGERFLAAACRPLPSGRGSKQRLFGEDGGYCGYVACWRGSANRGRG